MPTCFPVHTRDGVAAARCAPLGLSAVRSPTPRPPPRRVRGARLDRRGPGRPWAGGSCWCATGWRMRSPGARPRHARAGRCPPQVRSAALGRFLRGPRGPARAGSGGRSGHTPASQGLDTALLVRPRGAAGPSGRRRTTGARRARRRHAAAAGGLRRSRGRPAGWRPRPPAGEPGPALAVRGRPRAGSFFDPFFFFFFFFFFRRSPASGAVAELPVPRLRLLAGPGAPSGWTHP